MGKGPVSDRWTSGTSRHCEEVHQATQIEHEVKTATDDATECPSDCACSEKPSGAAYVPSTRGTADRDVDAAAPTPATTAV